MNLKDGHKEFQKEIECRGVEYLVHFTTTKNLYNILKLGKLMYRAKLQVLSFCVHFNDDNRQDDINYINLSLSRPNEFLFKHFRQKYKDDSTRNWCVLKIHSKHIYHAETRIFHTNAASNDSKWHYGNSDNLSKFKNLFKKELQRNCYDLSYDLIHRNPNLALNYPTDIQAEIVVKDSIPVESILEVCFESEEKMAEAKVTMCLHDTSMFVVDKEMF